MPDTDAYQFPDASDADQERYEEQQYAEALPAKRVTDGEQSVERHSLKEMEEVLEKRRQRRQGSRRMFTVLSKHSRR